MPSDSSTFPKNDFVTRGLYYASFIPLILIVLVFGVHAVQGVTGQQELRDIVSILGFGGTITAILVFFAGIHDGVVTALLVGKGKLFPRLPWWTVFLYAGIWPIVPRGMIWFGGGPFEWIEVVIFATLAGLAYWAHIARPKLAAQSQP